MVITSQFPRDHSLRRNNFSLLSEYETPRIIKTEVSLLALAPLKTTIFIVAILLGLAFVSSPHIYLTVIFPLYYKTNRHFSMAWEV